MRPAVFLDRDGTLIEERNYLDRLEEIAVHPDAPRAIRRLRDAGYAVVVVTNQSGVARGLFDEAFVRETHGVLQAMLGRSGASIDGFYYCPHHPEGSVAGYRIDCDCRKPATGMVQRAASDLQLDVARSFVVGDSWRDIELAARAGARGILVRTGHGAANERQPPEGCAAEAIVDTLLDAAEYILRSAPPPKRPEET